MNIEYRLEILEKELKKTKVMNRWLLGAVVLAAFLGAGSTAFSKSQNIIRANAISIVDDQGRSRIALGMSSDGPFMAIFGEDEKTLASLAETKDGPAVSFFNAKGKLGAGMGVSKEGNLMVLYGNNSEPGVVIGAGDKPNMVLFDKDGKRLWAAP